MKVLIVGMGALGTVYACLLKEQQHQVYGVDKGDICETIRNRGVKVEGIWGDHHTYLDQIVSQINELPEIEYDLILVTVKSFHTDQAMQEIKSLVKNNTYVCLLQNGYGNYETAAKTIPTSHLILGRVIFGAETLDMGHSKVTVIADDVRIGSPENNVPYLMMEKFAVEFSKAMIPTQATDKIMEYVWAKIIYNAALNPLGALFEVNYGKLAENIYTAQLMNQIIQEIFDLLKVMNQPTLWSNTEEYLQVFYQHLVPSTAEHHASMLQDIRYGRRTEIDALNGAVVQLAESRGIKVPVNACITRMIKGKERLTSKNL